VLVPFRLAMQERNLHRPDARRTRRGGLPSASPGTTRATPETSCARCGLSCCPRWRQRHESGNCYYLPGVGAALCGLYDLQGRHGVPGVDRHGTLTAYRMGETGVEHRPVPAFTGPGPGRGASVHSSSAWSKTCAPRSSRIPPPVAVIPPGGVNCSIRDSNRMTRPSSPESITARTVSRSASKRRFWYTVSSTPARSPPKTATSSLALTSPGRACAGGWRRRPLPSRTRRPRRYRRS
jgi:hypothetical protein